MFFDGNSADYSTSTPPLTLALSQLEIQSGASIRLTCIAGVTNAGDGVANSDCFGVVAAPPTDDAFQPACNSSYPSKFIHPSEYPVNLLQLIGSFSTDAGVVIGTPFVISPSGRNVQVPAGATKVQVGFNECKFADNAGALTFRLNY